MKTKCSFLVAVSLLIMSACNPTPQSSYVDQNKVSSIDTTVYDTPKVQMQQQVQQEHQQPAVETNSNVELVNVRIQNTFVNTDKTIPCTITLDEKNKVMTLEGTQSSDLFKMIYEGEGTFSIQFYNNQGLQASKIIYRREDLETEQTGQIYTSRTGEIIITISYQ